MERNEALNQPTFMPLKGGKDRHDEFCDGYGASHDPVAIPDDAGCYRPGCSAGCLIEHRGAAGSPERAKAMALDTDHPWHLFDVCEGCT